MAVGSGPDFPVATPTLIFKLHFFEPVSAFRFQNYPTPFHLNLLPVHLPSILADFSPAETFKVAASRDTLRVAVPLEIAAGDISSSLNA